MAIDFPDSPSVGQTTVLGDKTWTWNGTVWNLVTSSGSDHGTLGGLEDDDHTHYLLADGSRSVSGSILPDTDVTYDLGSATYRFRDLYLSGNSIDLGGMVISYDGSNVNMVPDGGSAQVFATETYVDTAVSNLVDTAPETLDTLNELAAALGDDANFATTITSSIATKQDASTALTTSTTFGGDVSGTYNAIVVADDSHSHSTYLPLSGGTMTGSISISSGSSENAFAGGSNYWRPQDAYGNSYFDINSGQFYVDSDTYYFRNRASTQNLTIDSSGNGVFRGRMTSSSVNTNSYSVSAPRWDTSFYVLQSQHWYGQDGSQRMYLGESGNTIDVRGYLDATNIYASGYTIAGSYLRTDGGNGQVILTGGNGGVGAIYLGSEYGSATGGIECSWQNALDPAIAIGVTRDYDNTKMVAAYNGYLVLYVDNVWRLSCGTGGVTYNGSFGASTMRLKENIRNAYEVEGIAPSDRDAAFDKLVSLRPVVYDSIHKPHDKWWVGCDTHENRLECEAAKCANDRADRIEHVCGKGWCYGTEEDPCPRYRQVRNRLHFIAEEVYDVYGEHAVGFSEDRLIESVDTQALYTEHINVTQHLIKYVRELESRIAELEAV